MSFPILVQWNGSDPRLFTALFRIGTAADAGLRLDGDSRVSVRHAVCHPYGEDWVIYDLGTACGTLVNTVRIWGPYRLARGDRVKIGRTVLTVIPAG